MVSRNLPLFAVAPKVDAHDLTECPVSVLIPARDESEGIAAAIESVLENTHPAFELIVMDDDSTDDTAAIVRSFAQRDARVRLECSEKLPPGWNGKQHACWQLAGKSRFDLLLFLDADVRLQPDAISRTVAAMDQAQVDLMSGFPRQLTGTVSEELLVPMMYFVLLGYLPFDRMRASGKPEFSAGCGQMFLAKRHAYLEAGGHRSIQASRHDGLKLPRSFRLAGFKTDLFDAADVAQVRMYHGWREVMRGVLKNANEGMANKKLIFVFTALLLAGSVLPVFSFAHAVVYGWMSLDSARFWSTIMLGIATAMSFAARYQIARRWNQSLLGVWLHPVAVAWFLGLQWIAFLRDLLGREAVAWRGRN